MSEMILVYTTCNDEKEAQKIGEHLLKKRLATCINIYPSMHSLFWWPPLKGKMDHAEESVLVAKTVEEKWPEVEAEILAVHSYEIPEVVALPVIHVNEKYLSWIKDEMYLDRPGTHG